MQIKSCWFKSSNHPKCLVSTHYPTEKFRRVFILFHQNTCWEIILNLKYHRQSDGKFVLLRNRSCSGLQQGNVPRAMGKPNGMCRTCTVGLVTCIYLQHVLLLFGFLCCAWFCCCWVWFVWWWIFFISSFPPQLHHAASPALLRFLITDTSVPKWKINWGSCHIVSSFRVHYYNYAMSYILNVAQSQKNTCFNVFYPPPILSSLEVTFLSKFLKS